MSEQINWDVRLILAQSEISRVRLCGIIRSDEDVYKDQGFTNAAHFWRTQLEERMRSLDFVDMVVRYFFDPQLSGADGLARMRLERALCEARESGEPWFIGDAQRPERGPNDLKSLRLNPHAASVWLLSMQRHRDLTG